MPGDVVLGSTLVDQAIRIADALRPLNASFGVTPWTVDRVLRTWTGGSPGAAGGYTDTVTAISPVPEVIELDLVRRNAPHGNELAGGVRLEGFSLTYSHPFLVPTLTEAQEVFWRLTDARGTGKPARWFTLAKAPYDDRGDGVQWIVTLRAVETPE